jgi:hypothetical protein
MEEERPIEKLLRRYAKKRGEERGAPAEMHPATRRMLQGEIARQFKNPQSDRAAAQKWFPRWALAFSAIVLAAVIGVTILPTDRPQRQPMEMARAGAEVSAEPMFREQVKSEAVKTPMPSASADALLLKEVPALKDDAKGNIDSVDARPAAQTIVAGNGLQPEGRAKAVELGAATRGASADSVARRAPTSVTATVTPAQQPALAFQMQTGSVPRAVPARAETAQRNYDVLAVQRGRANFLNVESNTNAVLAAFQVEHTGNELRVIDSDSSTYAGTVVLDTNPSEADQRFLKQKVEETAAVRNATANFVPQVRTETAQSFFFRVEGTNRTLNQQVVFTGNIISTTNLTGASGLTGAQELQDLSAPPNFQHVINNAVILGRAQLEGQKEVEVNAVPVNR